MALQLLDKAHISQFFLSNLLCSNEPVTIFQVVLFNLYTCGNGDEGNTVHMTNTQYLLLNQL